MQSMGIKQEFFRFGDLINSIYKAVAYKKDSIEKAENGSMVVNYITRTSNNNGCELVAEVNGSFDIESGNALTIGDTTATIFYQPEPFVCGDHIVVIRANWLNVETGLFVTTLLKKEQFKYSYGRALLIDKILDSQLYLPATESGEPNWQYIEKYINSLKPEINKKKKNILKISKGDTKTIKTLTGKVDSRDFEKWAGMAASPLELITNDWQPFLIGDLFDTYTGGDLILGAVEDGGIPVVTHSAENNSVSIYSAVIPGKKIFNHETTISLADRGTFFATIQHENFYIGTRVKALEAKFACNSAILMFIAVIINNEQFRFNYGRNCTGGLDGLTVFLPVQHDDKGKIIIDKSTGYSGKGYVPDWTYMEQFIKSLPYGDKI